MKIWLDGAIRDAAVARIDPADRGFTLGDGVFETIRARAGAPLHLERHLRRLRTGLAVLGISLTRSDAELAAAIGDALAANGHLDAAVRLTVSRGPAARGLWPQELGPQELGSATVVITCVPALFTLGTARLIVCSSTRRNEFSPLSRIKSINCLDAVLAKREALERGAEDALLLNAQGRVAEASAANVFVWLKGRLATPPVVEGALPGIARELLIERCGAVEASMTERDLRASDAVFLTNSLSLREATHLDGAPLSRRPNLLEDIRCALESGETGALP
jgi:branched-chain amino acid aminotransferase